ncbi:hypothetical protein CERZMDRAFT_108802 [Cercospora zeae-maydis SCOH1-5]|uniref:FAD-binding PCMH-type domain-containing protein n=1 Tax=Cercospora zeae-maydis SCOH1-5 TaxID=717836 RepID=A0A6A6FUL3_9PEZI|nr:hypothetical protein CERZMDRAFT_108802 [Cercospora zeae-maydis SCOH1-5]
MLASTLFSAVALGGHASARVFARQAGQFESCVAQAVGNDPQLYAVPTSPKYNQSIDIYNLDHVYVPSAVAFPTSAAQVAALVQCASSSNVAVQSLSGGHSYLNFGLGGQNGSLSIGLKNINQSSYDDSAQQLTFGTGNLLGGLTTALKSANRTAAYSYIESIGTGGHFAIGGLGPLSRQHGLAADQVVEVQVVTSDGQIVKASQDENEDLFWAVRGAAWSFGIVTSITIDTVPVVSSTSYSYIIPGNASTLASVVSAWQDIVSNEDLPREFSSTVYIWEGFVLITGSYYGSQEDLDRLSQLFSVLFTSHLPTHFYSKSLKFTPDTLPAPEATGEIIEYILSNKTDRGSPLWFVIWDLGGGAINDPAQDATAYWHRDALIWLQSYTINLAGPVSDAQKEFLTTVNAGYQTLVAGVDDSAYAGYVDDALVDPLTSYWGCNVAKLESIKAKYDSSNTFRNGQSIVA